MVDVASEKHYAELNRVINPQLPHGRNYFMGGTTTPGPSPEVATRVVNAQIELIKSLPHVRHTVIFETMHMGKVNSVPNDAMAYNSRSLYINTLVNLSWDKEGVNIEAARAGVKSLIKAVQGDDAGPAPSYSNYGELINQIGPMTGSISI